MAKIEVVVVECSLALLFHATPEEVEWWQCKAAW
jgi:hypothetical protein